MSESYEDFLESKRLIVQPTGIDVPLGDLNSNLFDWQKSLTRWALRKGRAALFLSTGLGKTICQLAWAEQIHRHTGWDVLVLAPLAVGQQTVREGERFGIAATLCRRQADVRPGINVTNYEMLSHFDAEHFVGIVLDESSVLKNFTGTVKRHLIATFRQTPYRLCCTATPAPNDLIEIANHADFLSIMPQHEIVALFFTPKGNEGGAGSWRLKAHARTAFYRWLASWSMAAITPADIGYPADGYDLPPLTVTPHVAETNWAPPGQLFLTELKGVTQRAAVRRDTLAERVDRAVGIVEGEPGEPWLCWYNLIAEGESFTRRIPDAVMLRGSDSPEHKAEVLTAFALGDLRVLVTHRDIAGFGMNFQRCARQVFLSITDSWESYYQAIRRSWRFGQVRPVDVHLVFSDAETAVYENILRKEREAIGMIAELIANVQDFEREELLPALARRLEYRPAVPMLIPNWLKTTNEVMV